MTLMLKILKFGIQRIPPKQVLAKNGEMKVLISELHLKMNLAPGLVKYLNSMFTTIKNFTFNHTN
jgi:hypothetical protein